MVQKHQLSCCALCQITATNRDSKQSIEREIARLKQEAKWDWHSNDRFSGERAAFVIVSPGEDVLERNLLDLGFRQITEFDRRNGYPEGILKMYFLNW